MCVREMREVLQATKEALSMHLGSRTVSTTCAEVSSYPAPSIGEEVCDTPSSSSSLIQEQPSCHVCVCVYVCMLTHGQCTSPSDDPLACGTFLHKGVKRRRGRVSASPPRHPLRLRKGRGMGEGLKFGAAAGEPSA